MKTYLQTKFKYFLLLGVLILPSTSFAISADLSSPQNANTSVTFTCTGGGNSIRIYNNSTGDYVTGISCGDSISYAGVTQVLTEYDSTAPSGGDISMTLTEARLNPSYVNELSFTWNDIIPFNPSLFGTLLENPTSLYDDFAEITRQHMWGGVFGWIILSLGIYTSFWLAMALIGLIGTALRKDKEKTDRINRLADNAISEYEAFDRKHRKS